MCIRDRSWGQLAILEQANGHRHMHACVQQIIGERHADKQRLPVPGDECQPALLGLAAEIAGPLAQLADGESLHGDPFIVPRYWGTL